MYVLFNRAALTVAYLVHSVQYFRSEAGTTVEWPLCAANHWECWGSSLLQCAALFALYDLFYVPWHRLLHVRLVLHSFEPVCAAASDLPLDSQASPSAGGLFPWYIRRNQHTPCRVCCRHIFASHFRRSSAARSRRGGVDSAAAGDCTFTLLPRLGVCGLAQPHALRGAHPVYLRRPGSRRSPSATAVQLRAVRYVVGSPIWVVSSIRGLL